MTATELLSSAQDTITNIKESIEYTVEKNYAMPLLQGLMTN